MVALGSSAAQPLRLVGLLLKVLRGAHVARGDVEELFRMVAQLEDAHLRPRSESPGEAIPLQQDPLDVRQNEVREAHFGLVHFCMRQVEIGGGFKNR
jgi:hypothetical protein